VVGLRGPADSPGNHGRPVEELLQAARQRLRRLAPAEAYDAVRGGAILVDIRPQAQRLAEGCVPGSLHVERNVLEWRFDPRSDARLPQATGYDLHLIIMCSQGYAPTLAAASLQDLGLRHATDLTGGFIAWRKPGCQLSSVRTGRDHAGVIEEMRTGIAAVARDAGVRA
jgi:rhodanese-related sulfurtransferase